MALLDTFRNVADVARSIAVIQSFKLYACTIVREQSTLAGVACPLGTPGATYARTVVRTLTPQPDITFDADPGDSSAYGGSYETQSTGSPYLVHAKVGPITPAYNTGTISGGYTEAQLTPPIASSAERYVWVLSGGSMELISGYNGVPFIPIHLWQTDGKVASYFITIHRATVYT